MSASAKAASRPASTAELSRRSIATSVRDEALNQRSSEAAAGGDGPREMHEPGGHQRLLVERVHAQRAAKIAPFERALVGEREPDT